jgi:hypothetical protein
MLAPMIVNVLVFSLLMLALGWVSDVLRAKSHYFRRSLTCEGTIGCNLMGHRCISLLIDEPDATRTVRRVRPRKHFGRLPLDKLSIGRVHPHGPDFVQ